jgi:hypothetical protein
MNLAMNLHLCAAVSTNTYLHLLPRSNEPFIGIYFLFFFFHNIFSHFSIHRLTKTQDRGRKIFQARRKKMKLSTGILALVAAICVTPAVSHGIPGDHITEVNSEAEYDAIIEEEHRRLSEAHANLRARVLQETGNADSLPILADYYGGEPGFYHSVGTLCFVLL